MNLRVRNLCDVINPSVNSVRIDLEPITPESGYDCRTVCISTDKILLLGANRSRRHFPDTTNVTPVDFLEAGICRSPLVAESNHHRPISEIANGFETDSIRHHLDEARAIPSMGGGQDLSIVPKCPKEEFRVLPPEVRRMVRTYLPY